MSLSLSEIVQNKIRNEGPISFHDFMEMALYYPELGYYTSENEKFGKSGDYFTAPFFTNVYGNVLARQLEEMWYLTGRKDFIIVEYGAGSGALCADILHLLQGNKEFYKNLSYCIIEKSDSLRKKQKRSFADSPISEKISWIYSIDEISPFTGCVLANEVLDNFSVHKVIMKEQELMEVFVDYHNTFTEVLKPASENLKEYFAGLDVELPNDFCAEVNLEAIDWLNEISASLARGFIITIDYGFPSSELYQPYRRLGTIVCYYKHSVNGHPYTNIGQQDITAHVNFSALDRWGMKNGLMNCGFTTQSQFLSGLGLTEYLRKLELKERNNVDFKRNVMVLHTLLVSMGKKFKVLIQQKGLQKPMLSGLQFCQPLV
ncbi:MAG TPA: SAM-dependent methyltransferase [Chitinophagaceae bacterium]|nr:SAM-dependent methyltransferase [Chitinophagaceae bacterium]